MKTLFYKLTPALLVCSLLAQHLSAQAPTPPPPPDSETSVTSKDGKTEVVIRQKGDKDSKLILEIKNGDFFINGKPLEKFDDGNVIIERRNMNDDDLGLRNFSRDFGNAYGRNDDDNQGGEARQFRDMQRKDIQRSMKIKMNEASLGVASRRAETGGATVIEVTPGSSAEKAGLKKGDIITKVNSTKIENPDSLFETIHNFKPGDKVTIGFMRDGKNQLATATLDKSRRMPKNFNYNYKFTMPPMPNFNMDGMDFGNWGRMQPKLGIKVQDAEDGKGVNVLEVEDSSAASKAGLKQGDIILKVDGADVSSTHDLIDQVEDARHKPIIKLNIQRGAAMQEIEIKIPRKLKTAEL